MVKPCIPTFEQKPKSQHLIEGPFWGTPYRVRDTSDPKVALNKKFLELNLNLGLFYGKTWNSNI